MWQGLLDFFFPRRLGRLNYFVRGLLWNIVVYPLTQRSISDPSSMGVAQITTLVVLMLYGLLFVFLARVRDSGMPLWSLVCIFIPGINYLYSILLLFRRSWTPIDEARAHPEPDESQIYLPNAPAKNEAPSPTTEDLPPAPEN